MLQCEVPLPYWGTLVIVIAWQASLHVILQSTPVQHVLEAGGRGGRVKGGMKGG